mmetsp:Transcript_14436/g.36260  ORF Transcript_14436/g.36260 Transcript_14436/m.36260 type:complete len:241 (+) Transcript_14436:981-1703(+)
MGTLREVFLPEEFIQCLPTCCIGESGGVDVTFLLGETGGGLDVLSFLRFPLKKPVMKLDALFEPLCFFSSVLGASLFLGVASVSTRRAILEGVGSLGAATMVLSAFSRSARMACSSSFDLTGRLIETPSREEDEDDSVSSSAFSFASWFLLDWTRSFNSISSSLSSSASSIGSKKAKTELPPTGDFFFLRLLCSVLEARIVEALAHVNPVSIDFGDESDVGDNTEVRSVSIPEKIESQPA